MSYSRSSEPTPTGPSDVYMFPDGIGICCMGCKLQGGNRRSLSAGEALEHLYHHIHAGHNVPLRAIAQLGSEAWKDTAWKEEFA